MDELTLYALSQFLETQHYPDVVIVSPRDYLSLLLTHNVTDNDAHTIRLLGTIWKRGEGELRELDWSKQNIGGPNG